MKKLLSLVLICAMGLGMVSCVESEESPSVEAIRNAKAEQLKALSNLYNAQAEAAKIAANAEAALLNAQAEYQKEMTKEAAEKFAVEIQVIKAQADSAILAAQKASAQYEKEILEMAHAKIQVLYTQYSAYAGQLAQAKQDLLDAKVELAAQEAGIVSVKEAAQNTVASETAKIAQYEAELAVLAASDLANAEDVNVDSLNVEKQKAFVAWQEAKVSYEANEEVAKEDALAAYREAYNELDARLQDTLDLYAGWLVREYDDNGNLISRYYRDFNVVSQKWYKTEDGDYVSKLILDETEIQEWKDFVATKLPSYTQEGLQDVQEALTDAEEAKVEKEEELAEAEENLTAVEAYIEQLEAAIEAKDAAVKTLTAAWKKYETIDNLEAAVKIAADNVKAKEAAEKTAKTNAENAAKALTAAQKALTDAKALEPKVKEHEAAIEAAAAAITAAENAEKTASDALKKAKDDKAALKNPTAVQLAEADVVIAKAEAELAAATAKVTAAVADKKAKEEAFKAFKTANKLTGTATEIAQAIARAEVTVFEAESAVAKANKAYADAQAATIEAKADSEEAKAEAANADAIAAAFVAAVAPAKEAEAALVTLLENEDFEDLGIIYRTAWYQVEYDEDEAPALPWQTVDENGDNAPDFKIENDVFTEKYALVRFNHTKLFTSLETVVATAEQAVEDAEAAVKDANYAVLAAKDDIVAYERALNNLYVQGFTYKWNTNPEAMEAELREWAEAMTVEYVNAETTLRVAYLEALDAATEAEKVVVALKGEYDAILELLTADNSNDITEAIDELNEKIATAKEAIAIAENVLNGSDYNSVEYQEAVLAIAKENVAKLEAEVEGLTKMVEHAKAELEAAVAAHVAE